MVYFRKTRHGPVIHCVKWQEMAPSVPLILGVLTVCGWDCGVEFSRMLLGM